MQDARSCRSVAARKMGENFSKNRNTASGSIDQSAVQWINCSERANRAAEPRQLRQSFSSTAARDGKYTAECRGPISKSIDKFFRQLHRTAEPVARPLKKLARCVTDAASTFTDEQPPIRRLSVSIKHQAANFPKNNPFPSTRSLSIVLAGVR